jgi:hypothetical protein
VLFKIERITSERVKDAKGRLIPSVMVRLTDDATLDDIEERIGNDLEQVLLLLDTTPGMSQAKIAEALGWVSEFGPDKGKVNRTLNKLKQHKLAEQDRRFKYALTAKGREEPKR